MINSIILFAIASIASLVDSKAIVGTNIGGWMVLEPWITPSLFYRFLGKTRVQGIGMDSYTLCDALGPEHGNKVMREHWDTWYTEEHIKNLSDRGVEMVRLPIGDWTMEPYGPYVGCMDGAAEKIDWFMDTCHRYNISVLMEVHCWEGSQNGYDNSGRATEVNWMNETHYAHWETRAANWLGRWNITNQTYDYMSPENVKRSISIVIEILDRWGKHPAFGAFEPVNEPWSRDEDMALLKDFYRAVRALVRAQTNPGTKFVFYADNIDDPALWADLFAEDDRWDVVLDKHYYQAWSGYTTTDRACDEYESFGQKVGALGYDVWVGEWSLATDKCAMWLGGLNEGIDSDLKCNWVDCPAPYMPNHGEDIPDRTADFLGPYA